jgi:hypothetical protein
MKKWMFKAPLTGFLLLGACAKVRYPHVTLSILSSLKVTGPAMNAVR